jgi:Carboxypeptidase regulatory-like domain
MVKKSRHVPFLLVSYSLALMLLMPLLASNCENLLTNNWSTVYAQRGEQGNIMIQVLDPMDRPLAGAKITLLDQSGQVVDTGKVTNSSGDVQLPSITPGRYQLQVEADGYETLSESNIEVANQAITRISLQLSPKVSISDVVTVKAESESLIQQGAAPQAEFRQEILKTAPLMSREFDQALPTIPNIIRGSDGRTSIKGSRENQSALLINDADSTDPATGNFALSIPLESVSKVLVYTNPYLPEYGRFTGGVTKVESKRGGDKFRFDITDLFPEPRFRGGQLFGITSVSPRVHLEGPILKDRLFFSQGLEYKFARRPVRGLPSPVNETTRESVRSFTQFDLIISPKQTFTLTFNLAPRNTRNIGLDFFNPQEVSPNDRVRDLVISGTDRLTLDNGSFLETIFQYKRIDARVFGKGTAPMNITPLGRNGNFFHREDRESERFQLRITDTLPTITATGTHNVKLGIDFSYSRNEGDNENRTVNLLRQDGTLAQRIDYQNPGQLRAVNSEFAAFAQDQWLVRPTLNIDYGIRVEAQRAIAAINVMPRLAISYSPDTSGRTVFRAAGGLFYDRITLNALSFTQQPRQTVTDFALDGRTPLAVGRQFVNLLGNRPNGDPNTGFDFSAARNRTFNLEFDRKINDITLLKISYLDSLTQNDLFVSPVMNGQQNAIVLFNNGRRRYRALEATTSFKFRQGNDLALSYVRSRARGELNDFNTFFGDIPEPVIRPNEFGKVATDAPNRFIARGTFKLPQRVSVSPLLDIRTGFPFSIVDAQQNFIGPRNSQRFPRFASLDMAITKDLKLMDKYNTQFTLSIFNVTNHFNPRNVRFNTADPAFGQFFANFRRLYRIDFGITW